MQANKRTSQGRRRGCYQGEPGDYPGAYREAYLPVLEALGQLCRGPQGAALVAQLAQYAPTWLLQMPAFLSPADVEELHRRVLGATQERMLRELAEALDVLTAEQLLVLVLEDLHWSDAATLDLLAYLAQRRGPARLLVLGTYRPAEAWARGHPLYAIKQELSLHGLCQEVALGWLTEAEVGQYLAARFAGGGVPARWCGWWRSARMAIRCFWSRWWTTWCARAGWQWSRARWPSRSG